MKKEYQTPEINIEKLDVENIITSSGVNKNQAFPLNGDDPDNSLDWSNLFN